MLALITFALMISPHSGATAVERAKADEVLNALLEGTGLLSGRERMALEDRTLERWREEQAKPFAARNHELDAKLTEILVGFGTLPVVEAFLEHYELERPSTGTPIQMIFARHDDTRMHYLRLLVRAAVAWDGGDFDRWRARRLVEVFTRGGFIHENELHSIADVLDQGPPELVTPLLSVLRTNFAATEILAAPLGRLSADPRYVDRIAFFIGTHLDHRIGARDPAHPKNSILSASLRKRLGEVLDRDKNWDPRRDLVIGSLAKALAVLGDISARPLLERAYRSPLVTRFRGTEMKATSEDVRNAIFSLRGGTLGSSDDENTPWIANFVLLGRIEGKNALGRCADWFTRRR